MSSVSENYFDSEELMSWLLLNPEMADLENLNIPILSTSGAGSSSSSSTDIKQEDGNLLSSSPGFDDELTGNNYVGTKALLNNDKHNNKTSAKKNKKRPREAEKDMQARVAELKAENADLHAHLLNVTQRTTEVQKQRINMEKLMQAKLEEVGGGDDSDQSELAAIVKQYTDIYADYGKCRQKEVAFHVSQLEKLILPTKTTKMCLWALQQDDVFFQKNKSPMYDLLSKELEITADQTEKIQERRERIRSLLAQLNESLTLLNSFKAAVEKKHKSYDTICGRVQDEASPKQIVLFLLWIKKNAETLAKYIPNFSHNIHHQPSADIIRNSGLDPNLALNLDEPKKSIFAFSEP